MEDGIRRPMNVVVAISGRGSNMGALLDHRIDVTTVLSNSPGAPGLRLAQQRGIKCVVGDTVQDICHTIERLEPDLVCLAGFMRLLPQSITERFPMMNIHPSLLPRFPGLSAQRKALESRARYSGCTVHMVDGGMDTGKIILQRIVPVKMYDTVESLSANILVKEHEAYAQAVNMFMERHATSPPMSNYCRQFKDDITAIEFALMFDPAWPEARYVWKNGNHVMVSVRPPEFVPHVAATPDDNFDMVRHRLDNMVDWNRVHAASKPGVMLPAE